MNDWGCPNLLQTNLPIPDLAQGTFTVYGQWKSQPYGNTLENPYIPLHRRHSSRPCSWVCSNIAPSGLHKSHSCARTHRHSLHKTYDVILTLFLEQAVILTIIRVVKYDHTHVDRCRASRSDDRVICNNLGDSAHSWRHLCCAERQFCLQFYIHFNDISRSADLTPSHSAPASP